MDKVYSEQKTPKIRILFTGTRQTMQTTKLNKAQLEILKLLATDISEEDTKAIKKLITAYFVRKVLDQVDELWEERGVTNDTLDEWLHEHKRTSY